MGARLVVSALMVLLGAGKGIVKLLLYFLVGLGGPFSTGEGDSLQMHLFSSCLDKPGQTRKQNSGLEIFLPKSISGFGVDLLVLIFF